MRAYRLFSPGRVRWAAFWILAFSQLVTPGTLGSQTEHREIGPPEVFARAALLREKLEAIRFEMGKPSNRQPEMVVSNVALREVFFQAITLFRKTDRLSFEQTRERTPVPEVPQANIHPAHVLSVVEASIERLESISTAIGISDRTVAPQRDSSKTPTDVFRSIVQANRQLNLLLDQKVSPSEVFQQVTLAVSYSSRLLARFPGTNRIPDAPEYVSGKLPSDVYQRLLAARG